MSIVKVDYGEVGGGFSETVLWQNSNSSADYAGSTTPVTLTTGKFSDYQYIKFEYKFNKNTSDDNRLSVIVNIEDWEKMTLANGAYFCLGCIVGQRGYARNVQYNSDTQFTIREAYAIAVASTYDNSLIIPLAIKGMN